MYFLDPRGEDSARRAIPDHRQVAVDPEPAGMEGAVRGKRSALPLEAQDRSQDGPRSPLQLRSRGRLLRQLFS